MVERKSSAASSVKIIEGATQSNLVGDEYAPLNRRLQRRGFDRACARIVISSVFRANEKLAPARQNETKFIACP